MFQMTDRRPLLRSIFDAAVARALPQRVLAQHLPPPPTGRIICLAAGKGAAALAPPNSTISTRFSCLPHA
jgi:glycerate 2-kinase